MSLPVLVLLPGMDGTGRLFEPLVGALSALDGRVVTHVVRYPSTQTLDYAALEALVRRALPEAPFVLLGESFSGPIAMSIAAAPPRNLVGLVLACTFARCPRQALRWLGPLVPPISPGIVPRVAIERWLLGANAPMAVRSLLGAALAGVPGRVLAARLRAVAGVDVSDRLHRIVLPVLSLSARDDRLVPRSAQSDVAHSCRKLREVVIDGPHALLQTRPFEAATEILSFSSEIGHASPDRAARDVPS